MVPLRRAGWTFPLAFIGALGGAQLVLWVRPEVVWHTALPMAAGQLVGGWLSAHLTVRGGDRVVRWVLLCVVAALLLKLSFDALRH